MAISKGKPASAVKRRPKAVAGDVTGPMEGDEAPRFRLAAHPSGTVSLEDFRGKRTVVLYFYPKDDTPGCTIEACAFRDRSAELQKLGAAVIGVSLDDVARHAKFAAKFRLPFPLLADCDAAVSKAYGVYKKKSLYGRSFMGIERSTFLIDKKGRIARAWRRVKVDGHDAEVIAALKELD